MKKMPPIPVTFFIVVFLGKFRVDLNAKPKPKDIARAKNKMDRGLIGYIFWV